MIKSVTLEKLCLEIHEYPPNWEEIISRFKASPIFNQDNDYNIGNYMGWLSEIHLDICLEEIAENHPELYINFEHPFREGTEIEGINLYVDRVGRLIAEYKSLIPHDNSTFIMEYDQVIFVGDKPVVMEIGIMGWKGRNGLKHRFRPENIENKLSPLKKVFRTDIGYVHIIPQNMYYNKDKGNVKSNYGQFQQNNGLVVPFYTDRYTFRREVTQLVQDQGLKVIPQ